MVIPLDLLQNTCHGSSQKSLFKLDKKSSLFSFSREGGCTGMHREEQGGSFFL